MNIQQVLVSQELAALKMLAEAIGKCPPDVWAGRGDEDPFWFKAQHTAYWAHRHLKATLKGFSAWKGHRKPEIRRPMSKEELLAYVGFIQHQLLERNVLFTPEKLEQEIVEIRHIQQHTGELYERLGSRKGTVLHWTEHVRRQPK